jgi:hypothetical protein
VTDTTLIMGERSVDRIYSSEISQEMPARPSGKGRLETKQSFRRWRR